MSAHSIRLNNDASPDIVAAVIAAVEAFLEDESVRAQPTPTGITTWRMAMAGQGSARGFGANVSWRGRD